MRMNAAVEGCCVCCKEPHAVAGLVAMFLLCVGGFIYLEAPQHLKQNF